MIKRFFVLALLTAPFAVWGMFKPIRVIAPQWNGVTCVSETLCLEDPSKKAEAMGIYEKSSEVVIDKLGAFDKNPRAIFCSTKTCFSSFGLNEPSVAATVGVSGVIISPQGWDTTKVSHEFIHHIQAEKFGVMQMFSKPEWLIEGMAYYLSGDDMDDVPTRYVEARDQFEAWFLENDAEILWWQLKNMKN